MFRHCHAVESCWTLHGTIQHSLSLDSRDVVLSTRTRTRVVLEYSFSVLVLVHVLIRRVLVLVLVLAKRYSLVAFISTTNFGDFWLYNTNLFRNYSNEKLLVLLPLVCWII